MSPWLEMTGTRTDPQELDSATLVGVDPCSALEAVDRVRDSG